MDFVTIKQQEAGIIPFGSRFPLAGFSRIAQGLCVRAAASLKVPARSSRASGDLSADAIHRIVVKGRISGGARLVTCCGKVD
jgi:hypothetical protein